MPFEYVLLIVALVALVGWIVAAVVPKTRPWALKLWWVAVAAGGVLLFAVISVGASTRGRKETKDRAEKVDAQADAIQQGSIARMGSITDGFWARAGEQDAILAQRKMPAEIDRATFQVALESAKKDENPAERRKRITALVESTKSKS